MRVSSRPDSTPTGANVRRVSCSATPFTAARAAANDPRWRDPKAHLLLRIRGLQESQLIAEAPTLTGRTLA